MRIAILTAAWKRYELFSVYCNHIKWLCAQIDCVGISVCSDELSQKLAHESGQIAIQYQNQPLGAKWNAGLRAIRAIPHDAILIIGSDDFASLALIKKYTKGLIQGCEFQGMFDCHVFNTKTKGMVFWPGYRTVNPSRQSETIGAGRFISRSLAKKLDYQFWDDNINSSLDSSLQKRLSKIKHTKNPFFAKETLPGIICCKGTDNITPFKKFTHTGRKNAPRILNKFLPKHISEQLLEL